MHRINLFVYNLIYVYQIRSYADISSITERFLAVKEILDKHFSKIFNICIPNLILRILSVALKFQLSIFNYFNQVSVFYINIKAKIVETFLTLQKIFTKPVEIVALQIIKIK